MEVLSMEAKETTVKLDGFSDIEESFKEELKQIGTNSSKLLYVKDVANDFELYSSLASILATVFKIYISTENLEGFLSVDPTEKTKPNGMYLTNFHELEETVNSIIILINEVINFRFMKENNTELAIVKPKESLTNSKYALEYFLEQFKEAVEEFEGSVTNGE